MNDIDRLDGLLREADPASGVDLSADGATARRLCLEARQQADAARVPSRLGSELARSSNPRAIWRRRLVLGAAAALAAVALVVVPSVWRGDAPAYAIRQLPSGKIEIDWSVDSYRADASAIAAELREYGVEVEITTYPASPSAVGGVVGIFQENQPEDGPPPGLRITEGTSEGLTWTIDPEIFQGPVTLDVNVPALPGETYASRGSVFMPGEVLGGLQCALGEPLEAADVAARLDNLELGITLVWYVVDPTSVSAHYYAEEEVSEVPDGVIFEGYSVDDATVELHVVPDGVSRSELHASTLSDAQCIPAQSAAWD